MDGNGSSSHISKQFNEDMEALKHNFLFRGYFKKLEKEEAKAKKLNP